MPIIALRGSNIKKRISQCQQPRGWRGRLVIWSMNRRHARVTDWGLSHVTIGANDAILDVGCGGGRTVAKLALAAPRGTVHGVDFSSTSVDTARQLNRQLIEQGRVAIEQASVLDLPYAAATFDLAIAVETHFWWSDLDAGMREVFRVLGPSGRMAIVAEFYNGGRHAKYADRLGKFTSMAVLDIEQHRAAFTDAGFVDVAVHEEPRAGWLCVVGTKPLTTD